MSSTQIEGGQNIVSTASIKGINKNNKEKVYKNNNIVVSIFKKEMLKFDAIYWKINLGWTKYGIRSGYPKN